MANPPKKKKLSLFFEVNIANGTDGVQKLGEMVILSGDVRLHRTGPLRFFLSDDVRLHRTGPLWYEGTECDREVC